MKQRNFVVKHDKNKGGYHKSDKDYDRADNKEILSAELDELDNSEPDGFEWFDSYLEEFEEDQDEHEE